MRRRLFPLYAKPSQAPVVSPPVWTVDPEPDPLSEPWAGGTIEWSDGTATGADSVTYDVRVDGVGQGVTAATWVVPAGIEGSDVLRRGTATNAGGDTVSDSSALEILPLLPLRAGASDLYLRDSGGQLADSGSPDYAYDGTGGSVLLAIDPNTSAGAEYLAGDAVGTRYAYDAIAEAGVGTLTGIPWTTRNTDGTAAVPSDTAYLTLTPGVGDTGTVVVRARRTAVAAIQGLFSRADNDGITILFHSDGTARSSFVSTTPATLLTLTTSTTVVDATDVLVAVEWDRATPGGGTGTAKLAAYRLDTYAQIGTTQTGTYATALIDEAAEGLLGRSKAAGSPAQTTLLRWQEFNGAKLITSGVIADVVDGSDPTGGGTLSRDVGGIRSGVYDPASPTTQIYSAGTGAAVEAGGST